MTYSIDRDTGPELPGGSIEPASSTRQSRHRQPTCRRRSSARVPASSLTGTYTVSGMATQIIKRGRSTPLDPALHHSDNKFITPRIILDATLPFEWKDKPVQVEMSKEMLEKAKARLKGLGLD